MGAIGGSDFVDRARGLKSLADEAALESFIQKWMNGTLPKPEWTHAAHLAACAWLAFEHRSDELVAAMKREVIRYNTAVGTPNTEDSGYHETLTRFWCALVEDAVSGTGTRLEAARAAVEMYGHDRDAPARYYSFNVAKNREARLTWTPPDLRPLPRD